MISQLRHPLRLTLAAALLAMPWSGCTVEVDDAELDDTELDGPVGEVEQELTHDPMELCVKARDGSGSGTTDDVQLDYINADGDRWFCTVPGVAPGQNACCVDNISSKGDNTYSFNVRVGGADYHGKDGLEMTEVSRRRVGGNWKRYKSFRYDNQSKLHCVACESTFLYISDKCGRCWLDGDGLSTCSHASIQTYDAEGGYGIICDEFDHY